MSKQILVNNLLSERQCRPKADLSPFISAVLQKRNVALYKGDRQVYWHPSFFGLDQLQIWPQLGEEQQGQVLFKLNQLLVEESFYIEKSGMTYTSKMALLAETNDERSLYNMLAADEAVHFQLISSYLLEEPGSFEQQPFLQLLDHVVHEAGYGSLIFIAQVLLEGWGLAHYLSLLKNCCNQEFSQVFRTILNDEAIHHGSGLVMTRRHPFIGREKEIVLSTIHDFFQLVRAGPVRVAQTVSKQLGGLNQKQLMTLYDDLQGEQGVATNLRTLTKLIRDHSPDSAVLDFITTHQLDQPLSSREFAKSLVGYMS